MSRPSSSLPLHDLLREQARRHQRQMAVAVLVSLIVGATAIAVVVWVFGQDDVPGWFDGLGRLILIMCLAPGVAGYAWWQSTKGVELANRPAPVTPMRATGYRYRQWSLGGGIPIPLRETVYLLVLEGRGLPRFAVDVGKSVAVRCFTARDVFVVGDPSPGSRVVVSLGDDVVFPGGRSRYVPARELEAMPDPEQPNHPTDRPV